MNDELVHRTHDQLDTLRALREKAHKNGVTDVRLVDREEVYRRESHLGPAALGGMFVPGEGILCTFTIPLACATQAVVNGVGLKLGFRVEKISESKMQEVDCHAISYQEEVVMARWVIKAAGLYSDEIHNLFGLQNLTVTPRRGELISTTSWRARWSTTCSCRCPPRSQRGC